MNELLKNYLLSPNWVGMQWFFLTAAFLWKTAKERRAINTQSSRNNKSCPFVSLCITLDLFCSLHLQPIYNSSISSCFIPSLSFFLNSHPIPRVQTICFQPAGWHLLWFGLQFHTHWMFSWLLLRGSGEESPPHWWPGKQRSMSCQTWLKSANKHQSSWIKRDEEQIIVTRKLRKRLYNM